MAVVKEWRCLAHGPFEGTQEVCPHGCTTVVREFRTAPGTRSAKTKSSDKALASLANRFGLSDMSNKNGESVGGNRKHPNAMAPVWGELPKGNKFLAGKGEVNDKGESVTTSSGAIAGLSGMGIDGKSVAAALSEKLGKSLPAEPSFGDIQKGLPRVRPLVDKRLVFGTPQQLDAIIEKK